MKKKLKIVFLILFLIGLIIGAGLGETKRLKVKEYNVIDKSLPNSFNGLKIIHFGDILYGSSASKTTLEKVVKKINDLKPDIVIFTGDLYAKDIKLSEKNEKDLVSLLKKINAKLYKYAIKGDNDLDNYINIMQEADFILLDGTKEKLYYKGTIPIIISNTLCDEDLFSIYLLHQADEVDNLDLTNINLVLSGHNLNGQIRVPFYGALIKKSGGKKYLDEKYTINNTSLYITSGIGTYTPNIRLFNPPSINLYRLTNY